MVVSGKRTFFLGLARKELVVIRMMDKDVKFAIIIERSSVVAYIGL